MLRFSLLTSDKGSFHYFCSIWILPVFLWIASGGIAAGGDKDKLSNIIENVEASEKRYSNYEVTFKYTHKIETPPLLLNGSVLSENEQITFVKQGDLFYFKQEGEKRVNDGRYIKVFSEASYDGQWTRVNENNSYGNKVDSRRLDPRGYLPHALMYRPWVGCPLSVYLRGGQTLKSDPSAGRYSHDLALKCNYVGTEVSDGHACFKIKAENSTSAGTSGFGLLWIAPEKNYLPIRFEAYDKVNTKLPISIRKIVEFKKADDGLDFPSRVSYRNYDRFALSKGQQIPVGSWQLTVDDIKISVNYPKKFFSKIDFAPNHPVYVIENAKVVNAYLPKKKDVRFDFFFNNYKQVWIFIFGMIIMFAIAYLFKLKSKFK